MPFYTMPLDEIDESLVRPSVFDVTKRVFQTIGLPDNVPILFKTDGTQYFYKGSEVNSFVKTTQDINRNRFDGDTIFYVSTEIEDSELSRLTSVTTRMEEQPIFSDKRLSVHMYPAMISKNVTLNFTITGTQTQVERWRSIMRRKAAQGLLVIEHMVSYSYPIPKAYMRFLTQIWGMCNNVAGYNDTLKDWLSQCFQKPITVLNPDNGNLPIFTVCEKQLPVQGYFEYGDNPPRPTKYNDTSLFSIEFTYHFGMDFPETVVLTTPPVIHNQILPANVLNQNMPLELDLVKKTGSISQMAFDHFRANAESQLPILNKDGLPIPSYDDWIEVAPPRGYRTLIKFMITVDPAIPTSVLNLNDFDQDIKFDADVIAYMSAFSKTLTIPYESIFLCNQFRWDNLIKMSQVNIDSDLEITLEEPMGLREYHHHVMYVVNDPSTLHRQAVINLLQFPSVAKKYLLTLYPFLDKDHSLDLINDWDVTDWFTVIDKIKDSGYPLKVSSQFAIWNLVGQFTINTSRVPK